jgi:hypothetical protein
MINSGTAVFENVRRYRTIASLYRQTAAFRPQQRWSLLDQAEAWERRAVRELEAYFEDRDQDFVPEPRLRGYAGHEMRAAA